MGFMSGPSMPSSSLAGPSVQPSSPPGPMMSPPPAPGFISPTSLPGGPMPFYPGAPHTQGPAPPPSGMYPPLGAVYPQGGPGAPAAKSFTGAIPPPPTGTCAGQTLGVMFLNDVSSGRPCTLYHVVPDVCDSLEK